MLTSISLAGCSNASGHEKNAGNNLYYSMVDYSSNTRSSISESSMSTSNSETSDPDAPKYEKVDIDMTEMNEVKLQYAYYDMLDYPDNYLNKVVKISGPFAPYKRERSCCRVS